MIRSRRLLLLAMLVAGALAHAQSEPELLTAVLKDEIMLPAVAEFQIRQYLIDHATPLPPAPATPQAWTQDASERRRHLLDVLFHGWPKAWIDAAPVFTEAGVIETGGGYRIRKLLYEIVPGFQSEALLYEPDHLTGKAPAILYVHGHVGKPGLTVEYGQKFCATLAKRGALALSLEWFSFGELDQVGNEHWFGAHLDLAGANNLGIFYLAMRRGLDYLYNHASVDRDRIGVTGLSGGGWQTIVLSALDERVKVSNPVAGFSAVPTKVEAKRHGDMGDVEQSASDFLNGSDYSHLVALMAPRPTLLTYNAEDDCCFRAGLVKPLVYDAVQPFFKVFNKDGVFEWYENRDPGDHNYQYDSRLVAYRFFSRHFNLPPIVSESGVASEVRSYDELTVKLPADNLTILGLAQKMGRETTRATVPSDPPARAAWAGAERSRLKDIVRYKPVGVDRLWTVETTINHDVRTRSLLFHMSNGLSANGVWLRSVQQSSDSAPVSIVIDDNGKDAGVDAVSDRVNRGEQVLALDVMLVGNAWTPVHPEAQIHMFAETLNGLGDRPVGMQAAQLIAAARWARQRAGVSAVRLDARGIRSQIQALTAAAIEPGLFSELVVTNGMRSLSYALDLPVPFRQAPDLFCLDLYKYFDIDRLEAIAAPVKVRVTKYLEIPPQPPTNANVHRERMAEDPNGNVDDADVGPKALKRFVNK